jgi:hypothetical protein
MSQTISTAQTLSGSISTVQTLNVAEPNVFVTGTVNAYGSVGSYTISTGGTLHPQAFDAAVFGPAAGVFTVNNSGTIESHGSPTKAFDAGIVLGSSGSVINSGIIQSASGIAFVGGSVASYVENSNLIEGSIGIGVVVFSGSGTVVNSGTLYGAKYGAVALFGGGLVSNSSTGTLSGGTLTGDQYAVTAQGNAPTTVQNAGHIVGYTGGIDLQHGGLVNNTGSIHAAGTKAVGSGNTYTNFYGGVVVNYGGTVLNGGTITGQNGVYLHYYNKTNHTSTPTLSLTNYINNSGQIDASSTANLHLTVSGVYYGIFGTGIDLSSIPGTVVNNGGVTASNVGVFLQAAGTSTIQNYGQITGVRYAGIMQVNGTAVIDNSGTIDQTGTSSGSGSSYAGIYLKQGGTILNSLTGDISGISGIRIQGNAANYVKNTGSINATKGAAVYFNYGGTVVNTGTITGVHHGIVDVGTNGSALGSIVNSGVITGGNTTFTKSGTIHVEDGVALLSGGNVSNQSGGTISGATGVYLHGGTSAGVTLENQGSINGSYKSGVVLGSAGGVLNYGAITGAKAGIYAGSGDFVSIGNTGTIRGNAGDGLNLKAGGAVADSGTIIGSSGSDAVYFGSANSTLGLAAGASFSGSIVADATFSNTLELAGSLAGSFDMGGTVSGFNAISFASAPWTLEGNLAELGGVGGPTISGFSSSDTLVLDGFTATSSTFSGGVLTLSNGSTTEQLNFASLPTTNFTLQDVAAGTMIELCYLRGTQILTPTGERPVEHLRPGDTVVTRYSGIQPIKWIGMQKYAARFLAKNPAQIPVCIKRGALGPALPAQDLFVSPGHSMLVDNTLVLAKNLVNGITVTQDAMPELVEYFAIELEAHDCVIAQGAFSESYADGPELRARFHNAAEFYALFPDYVPPQEIQLCAPRPERGALLAAALSPVVERARAQTSPGLLHGSIDLIAESGLIEGWAQDLTNADLPARLEVFLGAEKIADVLACDYREDLAQAGIARGYASFSLALPGGIEAAARRTIRVCRADDGAEIFASEACTAQIGAAPPKAHRRKRA